MTFISICDSLKINSDVTVTKNVREKEYMRYRNNYGDANIVGFNIYSIRKAKKISQKDFIALLRKSGLDINSSSYSKLEGQTRIATDKDIYYIAKALNVRLENLFDSCLD